MLRYLCILYLFLINFRGVATEEDPESNKEDEINTDEQVVNTTIDVVNAIEEFLRHVNAAKQSNSGLEVRGLDSMLSNSDSDKKEMDAFVKEILPSLPDITRSLSNVNNVYKFMEAQGIERVILPYLHINDEDLRTELLKMTQRLFDAAPKTTTAVIPIEVLDKILHIFEYDENMEIKGQILHILNVWLPDNPKVQARLMKVKGLEPFYDQIDELDANSICIQLQLFSRILKEHIKAINNAHQGDKTTLQNLSFYKKIGLIERLQTKDFCYGLFSVFQRIWKGLGYEKGFYILKPVFEIIMDVQPYCTDTLYGRIPTINYLEEVYKYVLDMNEDTQHNFKELGVNITALNDILKVYVDKLKSSKKDEF